MPGLDRSDPMVRLLPEEVPDRFYLLPPEEQKWRARAFLMVWATGSTVAHAWWYSLLNKPEQVAEMKAIQAEIPDLDNRILLSIAARYEVEREEAEKAVSAEATT